MATPRLVDNKKLKKQVKDFNFFVLQSNDTKLVATFEFTAHIEALVFIARITVYAEVDQHHPEITFTHEKVKVVLTTKLAKGITATDLKLAKKIEALYQKKRG